ncbi:hypothetical protein HDV05_000957 [Chytridiales sp. JEL 0842]|nr:hypothetical protein HDV05_000957 [Chytridiales sp. JEL 0842]
MSTPPSPHRSPLVPICSASYIRRRVSNPSTRLHLSQTLQKSEPSVEPLFTVVGMIDISGYSSLTSRLSVLGKLSSELVTNEVGAFMQQFLGDAILVTFTMLPSESSEPQITERALHCLLYISTHLGSFSMDLDKAIQDHQRAHGNGSPAALSRTNTLLFSKHLTAESTGWDAGGRRVVSNVPNGGFAAETTTTTTTAAGLQVKLEIHVALSAGMVEHVICGSWKGQRLDYMIDGECMRDLGPILDGTKRGELGFSESLLRTLPETYLSVVQSAMVEKRTDSGQEIYIIPTLDRQRLVYDDISSKSELPSTVTGSVVASFCNVEDEETYSLLRMFVNDSILNKLEAAQTIGPAVLNHKRKQSTLTAVPAPNVPLKMSSQQSTSTQSLTDEEDITWAVGIKPEFRTISIIFVKFLSHCSPSVAQVALDAFVGILRNLEGLLQQFCVDDKGQTMLACFGLPPWTHEKDPLLALKAAVEFDDFVKSKPEIGKISIGVATGEILISLIGTRSRADAGLLGDSVNVAARLLSIGNDSPQTVIKCDQKTFSLTKEDFNHSFLGAQQVKGKSQTIDVWSVRDKSETNKRLTTTMVARQRSSTDEHAGSNQAPKTAEPVFGYREERRILLEGFESWRTEKLGAKIIIQGKSGSGKSRLLDDISREIGMAGTLFCLTQGSQVKQFTAYYSIQNLVYHIFVRACSRFPPPQSTPSAKASVTMHSTSRQPTIRSSVSSRLSETRSSMGFASKSQLLKYVSADSNSDVGPYQRLLAAFLEEMDEPSSLGPLLKEVLPFLSIADNSYTQNMDGQTKRALLKSLIIRLVNKSLEMEPFVMIFDDTQLTVSSLICYVDYTQKWLDPISLDILATVTHKCSTALILLFMRPLEEKPLPAFGQILQSPNMRKMEIGGLLERDMESILLFKLSSLGVKHVSAEVTKFIYEKSEGLPLMIDTISESMKSQFSEIFNLSKLGIMNFSDEDARKKLEKVSSISTSVLMQFDRLHPQFQSVLRYASILGQYFDLEDIAFLVGATSPDQLKEIIEAHDTVHYLVKQDSEGSSKYAYYFRHVQIMNVIYESQSFAERAVIHLALAEHFESVLSDDPSSRDFLVPLVVHHYRKTDKIEKQIQYLEEMASLNFKKAHLVESANSFELLLLSIKQSNSVSITNSQKALWMARLAIIKVMQGTFTRDEYNLCTESLHLLGHDWPKDDKETKKMIKQSAIKLFKLWYSTKGGTRPAGGMLGSIFFKRQKPNLNNEKQKLQTLLLCYVGLFRLGHYSKFFTKDMKALVFLRQVTTLLPYGHIDKVNWAWTLYLVAFGVSSSLPTLSRKFFEHARKIEHQIPSTESKDPLYSYYSFKTMLCILHGDLQDSIDGIKIYIK